MVDLFCVIQCTTSTLIVTCLTLSPGPLLMIL